VIVDEDHGGCRVADDLQEDVSRMNDRRRERTHGQEYVAELPVLVVEEDSVELLALGRGEPLAEVGVDVAGAIRVWSSRMAAAGSQGLISGDSVNLPVNPD
jgi:hypothetical protein